MTDKTDFRAWGMTPLFMAMMYVGGDFAVDASVWLKMFDYDYPKADT